MLPFGLACKRGNQQTKTTAVNAILCNCHPKPAVPKATAPSYAYNHLELLINPEARK
jgi:hypothetical protein